MGPNGQRGRRISGFGVLARGSDFGPNGLISYAAEDRSGKLSLFREGSSTAFPLSSSGYLQSISFSPNTGHVVASIGQGNEVETWVGESVESLTKLSLAAGQSSLSPSVDDDGQVLHVVGPSKGPFAVNLGNRAITPAGQWAAMPSFCSTAIENRIVYMVRNGPHWDVRITSLVNGSTRTVVMGGMSPACSPDGRTVAFYSPGRGRQGQGIYLTSDDGGTARKVWEGQAASLRWRGGEQLPPRHVEKLTPTDAPAAVDEDEISADPGTSGGKAE
jgi:TolB protein